MVMIIEVTKVESLLQRHERKKNSLLAVLQDIQDEYNYLPKEALQIISKHLEIPLIDVVGVATFYRAFSLEPRGKHMCKVCLGTACHIRGGPKILDEVEKKLDIAPGQTTKDRQFTLETVNCLGCCAIGPVMVVDEDYHAHVSTKQVDQILKQYRKKG